MRSYDEAHRRIPTQREKIVTLLREAGEEGLTNADLAKICLRYGARLQELYKMGYGITIEHVSDGIYKYVLKKVPGEMASFFPDADDEIFAAIDERFNGSITAYELEELLKEFDFYIIRKPGWFRRKMILH